jgi:hypothetical protein
MNELVINDLAKEEMSEFHKTMLKDSRALVNVSRQKMSAYYTRWDNNDKIYRGIRTRDIDDKKAQERKEPQKMVVPVSYAQVQTFVAFVFSLFTQREHLYEILGTSSEDQASAKIAEALLARDLTYNKFETKLYQFLLDIARFGLGVFKTHWVREMQRVPVTITEPKLSFLGINIGTATREEIQDQVKYLGNQVLNISPYRFFPDPRLPLARFQEGEFVASEDEYTKTQLHKMEKNGEVSGIEWVKPFTREGLADRGLSRFADAGLNFLSASEARGSGQTQGSVILTEVQRTIVPSKYLIAGEPLGDETYPVKYNIWYVNDQRIVKCEPLGYLHDEYTYTLAEFNPDQHHWINNALSDTIGELQDVITWFINSRISSVRKVISNQFIVDPEGIEMKDIEARSPILRLRPSAGNRGVDRYIKQLDIHDVTQNHIQDATFLHGMVQTVTGINEQLLGQVHPGRRSATEMRNVGSSAASRLKIIASLIFRNALEPMGRQMLSNLRDGLDEPTVVRVVGMNKLANDQGNFIPVDKSMLVGGFDFEIFDGTLPSEKIFMAQTLEEWIKNLMSSPEAAIALQFDPRQMALEALELRGIRNPERFMLQAPTPDMVAQATALGQPGEPGSAGGSGAPPASPSQPNQAPQQAPTQRNANPETVRHSAASGGFRSLLAPTRV